MSMTPAEWTALIMAAIALAGVAIQFWKARSEKRRDDGDAAESISSAAKSLIEPLRKRVDELEAMTARQEAAIVTLTKKTQEQQQEITELRAGVMLLTTQIVALGQKPIYIPTRDKPETQD